MTQGGAIHRRDSLHADGKRRHQQFPIAYAHTPRDEPAGGHVLRHYVIHFQPGQA
jgi:hypothetical protein